MPYKRQQNAPNTRCGQCLWLQIPVKCNCGLEHGQPAQRTMSKVIFDGLLGFLTLLLPIKPKRGPNCAADVPVRGARARARARLVQEHHEHNWDPTFGRFQCN